MAAKPLSGLALFHSTANIESASIRKTKLKQCPMDRYKNLTLDQKDHTLPGVRVMFLGVSTILFDDGETAIMTDGFFSRPSRTTLVTGKIAPDKNIIASCLSRSGVTRLAAVIVTHSHYDHVMDAPEVARRTGAILVGSKSTANVGRGWGLDDKQIKIVGDGDQVDFGNFHITFVRSQHAPTMFTGGNIDRPLVPPVRATRYREGESFSVFITHSGRTMLVQASAGFEKDALKNRQADVVFLGIGALGKQSHAFQETYWRETVTSVNARRVIPVHWDDFMRPLDQPLVPLSAPFDNVEKAFKFVLESGRTQGIDVGLAPVWTKVDPFR